MIELKFQKYDKGKIEQIRYTFFITEVDRLNLVFRNSDISTNRIIQP